jgi:hypothetical protein
MLTVLHICLAANGRTPRSMAHTIKGWLMLSWVTIFLLTRHMETLRGSVERFMGKLFGNPFSKFYS